jgi:hypothetical protein
MFTLINNISTTDATYLSNIALCLLVLIGIIPSTPHILKTANFAIGHGGVHIKHVFEFGGDLIKPEKVDTSRQCLCCHTTSLTKEDIEWNRYFCLECHE